MAVEPEQESRIAAAYRYSGQRCLLQGHRSCRGFLLQQYNSWHSHHEQAVKQITAPDLFADAEFIAVREVTARVSCSRLCRNVTLPRQTDSSAFCVEWAQGSPHFLLC